MSKTYREIKAQFEALKLCRDKVEDSLPGIRSLLAKGAFKRILVLGCGSSFNVAQSLARIARTEMGIQADSYAAGDLLLNRTRMKKALAGALVIALSRSGSTSEMVLLLKELKEKEGAIVLALTCVEGSPLSQLADYALEMPWAFDESVCQTRTVSCLYGAGSLLIGRLSGNDRLAESLSRAIEKGESFMNGIESRTEKIGRLPFTEVVVLADGELEGIAGEGALAFKEICQVPSNYYPVLDSRHGPMVMIRSTTLVILALSGDLQYEPGLVKDLTKKGCLIAAYSDLPAAFLPEGAEAFCFGEALMQGARGLPFIVLCQMLSYYKALERGTDPDAPDGLDPWIRL